VRRKTHLVVAVGAVLAAGVAVSIRRPARLSPEDEAAWSRVVAALQQVAEEQHEALELDDPDAAQRRIAQLAAFLDQTSALLDRIGPPTADEETRRQVAALRARLQGIDYMLGDGCRAVVARILEKKNVPRTPRQKPDLVNGKRVFAESCAACHAGDGSGRGATVAMDPPPPDILHPQYNWSPYEMFNRVTYGGVETAMPSFEEGLSVAERWDVVFYLFAERWPPCKKPLPPISAGELAISGDFELGNKFGYGAAACLRREFR
jgi:mono/diheme cytochrome c family protein